MDRYRGLTKYAIERNKNTNGLHDTYAADLVCAYGRQFYSPFGEDGSRMKFRVILTNAVDHNSKNVIYSVIRDISHKSGVTLWYFHTNKCTLKRGDVIVSGTPVCVSAKNGDMTGPHVHFEVRTAKGAHINPKEVLALMKGGRNGILLGFPKK